MFFVSKQNKIETQLEVYRNKVNECLVGFDEAIVEYTITGNRDLLASQYRVIHSAESDADDIRREIEVLMYSKRIFPESRGDILGLLESVDRVPNQAESVINMIVAQRIAIPTGYCSEINQLSAICRRCSDALLEACDKLFSNFTNATVAIGKVDELESEADRMEAILIERIFSDDAIDGFQKIILRDMVNAIGVICDRAENAGDRIRIIVAKRSL